MADEILSSAELDALLSAPDTEGRKSREASVLPYDFVRPNKLSGEQLRALQRMHESIAQNVSMVLSTYLRINVEVSIISLGELTFEVFRDSLPNPTVVNVLSMAPLVERSLCTLDIKLAFSLIDRMLGGPGKALEKVRALTTIELSLLDNVVIRLLEQVALGWKQLISFTPIVEAREMDPQFVQVIPSSEMVLVATFSVAAPGEIESGEVCFCIPFISLEGLASQLGNQFHFATMKRAQTPGQRSHLDDVIKQTALEVRAVLGTTTLTIGEIMDMKTDDILVLDQRTDARAVCYVAGRERFLGRPGRVGKMAGVMVDQILSHRPGPKDKE